MFQIFVFQHNHCDTSFPVKDRNVAEHFVLTLVLYIQN